MGSRRQLSHSEIMPMKLSSPPPKPPRRRHSDQSSAFSSGPYGCGKKKFYNGDMSPDVPTRTTTSNSGSESLPLTWTKECSKSPVLSPKNFKINSSECPEKCSLTTSGKNNQILNIPLSQNNKLLKNTEGCFNELYADVDKYNFKLNDCFKYQKTLHSQDSYSENNNYKKINGVEIQHRRYHSDPSELISVRSIENSEYDYIIKDSMYILHNDRDILINEIKIQKEINLKLWHHRCSLQAQLDSLQQSRSLDNNSKLPSFSELMMDVYKAQREKDIALECRLKSALQLRDSAIQELEHILRILVRNFKNGDSNKSESCGTIKNLEQFFQEFEIVDNPVDLLQKKHALLAHLYQVKEDKIRRISDELKCVNEEKKEALLKVQNLEEEISELKNSIAVLNSKKDVVSCVTNHHDFALEKMQSLQNLILCDCTRSKIDFKSIESVDTISSCCDKCNNLISRIINDKVIWSEVDGSMKMFEDLLKNFTHLLTVEMQKRQNAEQACSKLHRMLNFVLEKMNGLNIGVPV